MLENRNELGLRTTLYSCTEHQPGNFSLSAPVESYWSIINAGKSETAGFLRWAYYVIQLIMHLNQEIVS